MGNDTEDDDHEEDSGSNTFLDLNQIEQVESGNIVDQASNIEGPKSVNEAWPLLDQEIREDELNQDILLNDDSVGELNMTMKSMEDTRSEAAEISEFLKTQASSQKAEIGAAVSASANASNQGKAEEIQEAWKDVSEGTKSLEDFRERAENIVKVGQVFGNEEEKGLDLDPRKDPDLYKEMVSLDEAHKDREVRGQLLNKAETSENPYLNRFGQLDDDRSEHLIPPMGKQADELSDTQVLDAALKDEWPKEKMDDLKTAAEKLYKDPEAAVENIVATMKGEVVDKETIKDVAFHHPETFGETKTFEKASGFLGLGKKEDAEASLEARAEIKSATREVVGSVQAVMADIRQSEAELRTNFANGVPSPSKDLENSSKLSAPGKDMDSGLSAGQDRGELAAEAGNLMKRIDRATVGKVAGAGLTAQMVDRLKNVQDKAQQVQQTEKNRQQELAKSQKQERGQDKQPDKKAVPLQR